MLQINNLSNLVRTIIEHQASVIGPLAYEQANKVDGLVIVDFEHLSIKIIKSDSNYILTNLVKRYEELFGKASIEVCKDAVKEIKPPVDANDLPEILR